MSRWPRLILTWGLRAAFGQGFFPASINVLLVLSYIAVMAVYAAALASYSAAYLPEESRTFWMHLIASGAIIALGLINVAGAALMQRIENVFDIGKLAALGLFIIAGFLVGQFDWSRLTPAAWVPVQTIVASGMLGFLAYEGFELIANASGRIRDPKRTLPIAFLGSVLMAMAIYVLAFVVAIGHMSFADIEAARGFALSEVAGSFLGPIGFAIIAVAAVLASASAINADFFGASKLPVMLAEQGELPPIFQRRTGARPIVSFATIGVLALLAVNLLDLHALSAATSAGFLVVFAAVNCAAVKLAPQTGSRRWISALAAFLCVGALIVMMAEFLSDPATRGSGIAVGGIMAIACLVQLASRAWIARGGRAS